MGVDLVDEVGEEVVGGGRGAELRGRGRLQLRIVRVGRADHVLVGAHVPGAGVPHLQGLVHHRGVVRQRLGPRDVQPGRGGDAGLVLELELRVVLQVRVHVARGVDLRHQVDVVLLRHRDQGADLRLRVVAPERRRRVGVAPDLRLDPQLVELLGGHVLHQPLEPGQRDVDVAGADPDPALAVGGDVRRRTACRPAVVVQQLEHRAGAVEHPRRRRGGDRDPVADVEAVALRAQRALQRRVLAQHDVTGAGPAP